MSHAFRIRDANYMELVHAVVIFSKIEDDLVN
jgi:hypothetical protein